jgi:acetyl esterase/lipase
VHELHAEWVSWYGEEPPLASEVVQEDGLTSRLKRRASLVEWAVEEAKRTVYYEALGTKVEDRGGKKGVVLYLHGGAYAMVSLLARLLDRF